MIKKILFILSCTPALIQSTLRIGGLISNHGKYIQESAAIKEGYDFWQQRVNAQGGIKIGTSLYTVEIIYEDDESDPKKVLPAIEYLRREKKVSFILGPYSSELNQEARLAAEKNKIVLVQPAGDAENIFSTAGYMFGISAPAHTYLDTTLTMLKERNAKTIALVEKEEDFFSQAMAKHIRTWAKQNNIQIVAQYTYPMLMPTIQNDPIEQLKHMNILKDICIKAKLVHPDVFIATGHYYDSILLIDAAQNTSISFYPPAFVLCVGPGIPSFIDHCLQIHRQPNYVIGPSLWDTTVSGEDHVFGTAQNYANTFKQKYAHDAGVLQASASAAALALQLALEKAGKIDVPAVRASLKELNSSTFYGPISFNKNCQNAAARVGVIQIQDNRMNFIYNAKDLIYPAPAAYKNR